LPFGHKINRICSNDPNSFFEYKKNTRKMLDQSLLMSEERKQQQTDLFNKTRLRVKFESQGPLKTSAEDFKKLVFMDIITREEYE
jgi:hypothetical protein